MVSATRDQGRPAAGRPAPNRRVLVVRLDSMGDVLLTGGAVRAVAGSAARVGMLVGRGQRATARLLPGVDEVLEFDAPWVPLEPAAVDRRAVGRLVRVVRRRRFAAALIFTSYHQSPLPTALTLRLAGVPWIGAISEDYPGALLDLRHRVPADLPEAERNLSLAVAAGFVADADGAPARCAATRRQSTGLVARSVVRRGPPGRRGARPPPITGSIPGLRRRARRGGLAGRGHRLGGERELTAEVAGTAGIDAAGRLDLPGLTAVLAGARVAVVGNTGPAHLAAAVGTSVVSLFAPVVPAVRWAPYGVPVITLGDQHAACRDSRARVCPVPGHPCLDAISTDDVVAAVQTLAAAQLGPPPASPLGTVAEPSLDVPTGGRP